jgi:uncharacterized cupin superfamily protein
MCQGGPAESEKLLSHSRRHLMADLGGGFYVSRVDSDDYEPDDEAGGFAHMLFEEGEAGAGLWKPDRDTAVYEGLVLPARETIVVLRGSVRIDVQGGPILDLGVGDMASMPKGAVTTWHASPDFEEIWVYH